MERIFSKSVVVLMFATLWAQPAAAAVPGTLVRTIETSRWRHPSPDPTGVVYRRSTRRLIVSDSEVDEISRLWDRRNLFVATRKGRLVRSGKVTFRSLEPEDIAWDGQRKFLYVADDDLDAVIRFKPGPDRVIGTVDDRRVEVLDTSVFGSRDPEGLAVGRDGRSFFVADARGSRIFHVRRGGDARFGTPDDIVTSFDAGPVGADNPEGVSFQPIDGHLFIAADPKNIVVTTVAGSVVATIDISGAHVVHPSAIAVVRRPGSVTRIYLADRGRDNRNYPRENDGRVFVFDVGP